MKAVTALATAVVVGTTAAGITAAQEATRAMPAAADSDLLEVTMVERGPTDMRFEPADLVVEQGDVIRFVQQGDQPHNVEFTEWPDGVELGDVRVGPFLTRKDEVYELEIDDRFAPGEYDFVCTPHIPMGMVGTITVVAAADAIE